MNRRLITRSLTWLLAVAAATSLGLVAVGLVGDAARGRGPLGDEVTRTDQAGVAKEQPARLDDADRVVRRTISRDFGIFVVSCQGPYARGLAARAAETGGWRAVRFEPGPDDDVEAVFASASELVELEVFCNRGRPAVAELDRSRVTDDQ